jgi:hypothetical protein
MSEIQQRARDVPSQRRHARQPAESGATQQMQQNCLRLVVTRVSDADAFRAHLDGDTAQEGVACVASGVLQRAALLFGDGRYIHRGANKPQPLLARKLFDPGRVLASLGATQPVIQMRDDDLARSAGGSMSAQLQQRPDETERISAARDRDHDARARLPQIVTPHSRRDCMLDPTLRLVHRLSLRRASLPRPCWRKRQSRCSIPCQE